MIYGLWSSPLQVTYLAIGLLVGLIGMGIGAWELRGRRAACRERAAHHAGEERRYARMADLVDRDALKLRQRGREQAKGAGQAEAAARSVAGAVRSDRYAAIYREQAADHAQLRWEYERRWW